MNPANYIVKTNWFSEDAIQNTELNDDGRALYVGVAQRRALNSEPKWLIFKFTYENGYKSEYIRRSKPGVKWDDRATESYL